VAEPAPTDRWATLASDPRAEVVLKVLAVDGSVRRFHLGAGEHVVGSGPGSAVQLDDTRVSRRHATLEVLADGGVVLTDLESRNGTFLHGRRLRRTALRGLAVLSFGPVHAVLRPADPVRAQVLLGPGAAAEVGERQPKGRGAVRAEATLATGAAEGAAGEEHATSHGFYPLGRLAESLHELLPRLLAGDATVEATAEALARRLPTLLPVGRVELLRIAPDGTEALVAAAATGGRLPKDLMTRAIDGPAGWRLSLRAPDLEPLRPAEPLLALALEVLALAEGQADSPRHRRRSARASESPDAGGRRPPLAPAGLGPEMARVYRRAGKVARGDVPVLILGESGSGKEVLARWIHARSTRPAGPFLAVNCAALPRELLEAELFGIERGVATGVEARAGILERAGGGTVFLDEIGDMAPELQAKLLRVLESTSLYRLGGRNPVVVDVRFLAATNRELTGMVEQGSFRRDLYHRLAAFEAFLPPLRRRREEIPALAARFFRRETEKNDVASLGITRAALGAFVRYAWPGNVRELENEIAKAVLLLESGEPLDLPHLSERVRGTEAPRAAPLTLEGALQRAEREAFAVAQAAAEGDPLRAMELLGISRTTYYRKLKELAAGD
jgi:DNA-binding NtrC family response regulator/pSer/pThr/pTyr-binding forkhead associated (FHA) protein